MPLARNADNVPQIRNAVPTNSQRRKIARYKREDFALAAYQECEPADDRKTISSEASHSAEFEWLNSVFLVALISYAEL